jgi:hypothetical protein
MSLGSHFSGKFFGALDINMSENLLKNGSEAVEQIRRKAQYIETPVN